MSSITDALDGLEAAVDALTELDWPTDHSVERLKAADRLETLLRRQRATAHRLIHHLDESALGAPAVIAISDLLRITRTEARRRLRDAEQLTPRTSLTGQPLPPALPATATAWTTGLLDPEHLRTIQNFIRDLPSDVVPAVAEKAENFLADQAALLRPDQLRKAADALAVRINPDGKFTDHDRARHRGFTWTGPQRPDGMSVAKLIATPELRATIDALLAKFAAPGMCNPADHTPTVTTEPHPETIDLDTRSHPQRQHDALTALLRDKLTDPTLGRHNGLPVTIIATATVEQLCTAAGHATTAGGTQLPMRELIRLASHSWHYLCIYDNHTQRPLYLGRTKRIASADQRLVLHALDRGCTAPGCTIPGYLTEVHHITAWATDGQTNIDNLTFACRPHHRLLTTADWTTRKNQTGATEWIPPPNLPLRGGTNTYHHPERPLDDTNH